MKRNLLLSVLVLVVVSLIAVKITYSHQTESKEPKTNFKISRSGTSSQDLSTENSTVVPYQPDMETLLELPMSPVSREITFLEASDSPNAVITVEVNDDQSPNAVKILEKSIATQYHEGDYLVIELKPITVDRDVETK